MTDNRPWWVAIANTGHEKRADLGLRDRGFEVWYPTKLVDVKTRHMKRSERREYPVYPGYLFARHEDERAWPRMKGVDGIVGFLRARCGVEDWMPLWVTHQRLMRIMIDADAERQLLLTPPVEDVLSIGDRVFITEGPFASFEAVVQRLLGRGGVEVAAEIFGGPTRLSISRRHVEAVA